MRIRSIVMALVVAALIAPVVAPRPAQATSYEDQLGECSYPKFFDLAFMRPISFSMTVVGTAAFIPVMPWALITTRSAAAPFETLVAAPARFTFARDLGECPGIQNQL
jgi:hypothetical protein